MVVGNSCDVWYLTPYLSQKGGVATVHSVVFSKTLFDFKNRVLVRLSSNSQEKPLNSIFYAPIYFGVSIFSLKGSFSFGGAQPAGFGSLKTVTNCFWPRKVGDFNGLFVLEDTSSGCNLRCRKNQTNGRTDQPTRS